MYLYIIYIYRSIINDYVSLSNTYDGIWIDDKYFHAFINHIIIHYCYYFKCFAIVSH